MIFLNFTFQQTCYVIYVGVSPLLDKMWQNSVIYVWFSLLRSALLSWGDSLVAAGSALPVCWVGGKGKDVGGDKSTPPLETLNRVAEVSSTISIRLSVCQAVDFVSSYHGMIRMMIKWNTLGAWAVGPPGKPHQVIRHLSEACEGALVPVTLGHVKDPGEFLIARFLDARIAPDKWAFCGRLAPSFPAKSFHSISHYFSIKTIPRRLWCKTLGSLMENSWVDDCFPSPAIFQQLSFPSFPLRSPARTPARAAIASFPVASWMPCNANAWWCAWSHWDLSWDHCTLQMSADVIGRWIKSIQKHWNDMVLYMKNDLEDCELAFLASLIHPKNEQCHRMRCS